MPAAIASRDLPKNNSPPPDLDPLQDPTSSIRDYPGFLLTHIWNGLAIFAIFVIARYLVQTFFQRRIKRHFDRPSWPPVISPSSAQAHLLVGQQRLHSHFVQGPFWTTMDEKSHGASSTSDKVAGETTAPGSKGPRRVGFVESEDVERDVGLEHDWQHPATGEGAHSTSAQDHSMKRHFLTRPPPPPPLTPPELSTVVFTFDDRRRNYSGAAGGFDPSFIHQPNPDYMSSTTTSASHTPGPIPSLPRRRSYTKTLPIGIPAPQTSAAMSDAADLVLSPSSYPPTSPLLPPAPPGHEPAPVEGAEIGVQGEVISLMDHHGAGWKRHTRVYGGGVCLACAAAGGEGGFYGDKVREEEKR